jgi:hypothetical protein
VYLSRRGSRTTGFEPLRDVHVLQVTGAGCTPLLDTEHRNYHCRERMEFTFRELVPKGGPDGPILAARWRWADEPRLRSTLDYLKAQGMPAIVLGPTVEYSAWAPELVLHHGRLDGLTAWVDGFLVPDRPEVDRRPVRTARESSAEYFSVIEAFCRPGGCPVTSGEGKLLVLDYGHHTPAGARALAAGLAELGIAFPRRTDQAEANRVAQRHSSVEGASAASR